MEKWYKKLKWRNLMDMHIPDWDKELMSKFDSAEYARLVKKSGSELCEFYAENCLGICFFDTKIGHKHAGIGDRDLVQEVFEQLDKQKTRKMTYYNIWNRWAYESFPQWRIKHQDGSDTTLRGNRFAFTCINHEEYRQFVHKQLNQLITEYESCGLWIDMLGWFREICYCESCAERFMKKTGKALPKAIDWSDPDWMSFQRFREESMVEFIKEIKENVHKVRPGMTIVFNCASWTDHYGSALSEEFMAENEYLAGDFYSDSLRSTTICKALNNLTENRPVEFMISANTDLSYHTTLKSIDELRNAVYASIAHNAAFVFIDAINPDGSLKEKVYEKFGNLKKEVEHLYDYWNPDAKMLSDVGLYFSLKSAFDPRNGESKYNPDMTLLSHIKLLTKTMIASHIPYDIIFRKNLKDAIKDKQTIILSDVFMIDDYEAEFLTQFVENGGNLIITGLTGMYDAESGKNENFRLAHLMGVDYAGEMEENDCYFNPAADNLFDDYDEAYPMFVRCPAVKVRQSSGKTLATIIKPWSHSREEYKFGCAHTNPPREKTDFPAVTLNTYGKGRVLYIASPFECDENAAQRHVFTNMVKMMTKNKLIYEVSAPSWLDVMVYDDENGRYRLVFYKAMEYFEECDATDVDVTLRILGITSAFSVMTEKNAPVTQCDEGIKIHIDKITDFEMLVLS